MLNKIDAPIRAYLQGTESMIDIVTKYTKLDLLLDKRSIDYRHRKRKTTYNESNNVDCKDNQKNVNKNENRNINSDRHYKSNYLLFIREIIIIITNMVNIIAIPASIRTMTQQITQIETEPKIYLVVQKIHI